MKGEGRGWKGREKCGPRRPALLCLSFYKIFNSPPTLPPSPSIIPLALPLE